MINKKLTKQWFLAKWFLANLYDFDNLFIPITFYYLSEQEALIYFNKEYSELSKIHYNIQGLILILKGADNYIFLPICDGRADYNLLPDNLIDARDKEIIKNQIRRELLAAFR